MLRRIVAADGTIKEGTRERARVGDVEEVGDIQGRGGKAVKDTDCPSFLGEASVPCADIALGVGVHMRVASVPEEPDVLLIKDGLGVKEIMIDFRIRTQVKEVRGDGEETCWDWVRLRVHCAMFCEVD